MKYFRVVLLLCGLSWLAAGASHAQDRIFLRQGRTIEAKVVEITSTTVRFYRSDNLEGPIYVYEVCDIDYIRLGNGTVERFAPCSSRVAPGALPNRNVSPRGERSILTLETAGNAYIQYTGGSHFMMNGHPINMRVARAYVQAYCPEALKEFEKGREAVVTGVPLIYLGALVGTTGLTLAIINMADRDEGYIYTSFGSSYRYDNGPKRSPLGGWMLFGVGALASIIGTATTLEAANHFGPAIRQYNEKLGFYGAAPPPQPKPSWSMSVAPTGLGAAVTVRF
ncbi:MAG: hypothetical protein RMJ33_02815 [Saprospiraceae bacterium]|nr:hypothetical protein [Saprospiraceae bacterium]MDW8228748.1 hypothetical protein [Saprospiraceae bacterium]